MASRGTECSTYCDCPPCRCGGVTRKLRSASGDLQRRIAASPNEGSSQSRPEFRRGNDVVGTGVEHLGPKTSLRKPLCKRLSCEPMGGRLSLIKSKPASTNAPKHNPTISLPWTLASFSASTSAVDATTEGLLQAGMTMTSDLSHELKPVLDGDGDTLIALPCPVPQHSS